MARDYKHRASRKRKKKGVSPWFGVFAGLLIGLFVAFLVFLKMQTAGTPSQATLVPAPVPVEEDVRDVRKNDTGNIPPPPKPRFDFYTLLPEMEVVVPEEEVEARVQASRQAPKAEPAAAVSPVGTGETWYLQVISLRDRRKAESFRAELALLGLEAGIQTVTINGTDTYHRVRVGPFSSVQDLDDARRTLGKQGIDSKTIRVKG